MKVCRRKGVKKSQAEENSLHSVGLGNWVTWAEIDSLRSQSIGLERDLLQQQHQQFALAILHL